MDVLDELLLGIKGEYKIGYALSHLTWFKVGGPAELLFKPSNAEDLSCLIKNNLGKMPITVIGAGSNLIIRDGGIDGIVVKLGKNFTDIQILDQNQIAVGAGCLNFNLAQFCKANFIKNFEFLVGIPGTVGGGIVMNAGSYDSEFKDITLFVEGISSSGELLTISSADIGFGYRKSSLPDGFIVTKVIFKAEQGDSQKIAELMAEISQKRSSTQPIKERTSGSTFVNPENVKAWQLIDKAGLRGYKIGDAQTSKLHCNFIINLGNATASELESLGEYIRSKVSEQSKIMLEWEIKMIGKHAKI